MSKQYFEFKQFTVYHDLCAMKVGTDGVLLGATATGGKRILDIGTGTGLGALMMAQRFPNAIINGIDIDDRAVIQAKRNVEMSPFANRVTIHKEDFTTYYTKEKYDSIICNPPFFEDGVICPDVQRSIARHTESLPFSILFTQCSQILADNGTLTIIIPTDSIGRIEEECAYASLFIYKRIFIRTVERKQPKRVILFITNHLVKNVTSETQCLMKEGERSEWYKNICIDFYL